MDAFPSYPDELSQVAAAEPASMLEESVVAFDSAPLRLEIKGVKASALERLGVSGFPIPAWFLAMPAAMFSGGRRGQLDEFLQLRDPTKVKYFAQRCTLSARASEEIAGAVNRLLRAGSERGNERDSHFAVRVSLSPDETANRLSDVEPLLYLRADDVPGALMRVWQSVYSEEALLRRLAARKPLVISPPALIVQRMVRADASGVAYGGDPLTGRRGAIVIAGVYGLGTSIVSGESDVDTYEMARDHVVNRRDIACKQIAHVLDLEDGHGVSARLIPSSQQELPLLTDAQVSALSELTWQVGELYDRPQEIEWAMEAGRISLLGASAAPALSRLADPDAAVAHWSRSALGGTYPGILSALSYTLARLTLAEQFRSLSRASGMPDEALRARSTAFDNLMGQIDGGAYLNLDSGRELISALPQPEWRRVQLAESLGIGPIVDGVSDAAAIGGDPIALLPSSESDDNVHLDVLGNSRIFSLLQNESSRHDVLQRDFAARLKRSLDLLQTPFPVSRLRLDELVARVQTLRRSLIENWDAPSANQLVAAASFALLGQLTSAWCDDAQGRLRDDLMRNVGELPGTAAARKIAQIAASVSESNMTAEFRSGSVATVRHTLDTDAHTSLRMEVDEYLDAWGDVVPGGSKVEEATLRDNPLPLLRACAAVSTAGGADVPRNLLPTSCITLADAETTKQARVRAERYYSDRTMRRRYFDKVYALARRHAREQELYQFDRIRVFAAMRKLLIEIGKRLYSINALDASEQIVHLQLDEIIGYTEGTGSCTDLRGLAFVRQRQHDEWLEEIAEHPLADNTATPLPVAHSSHQKLTAK